MTITLAHPIVHGPESIREVEVALPALDAFDKRPAEVPEEIFNLALIANVPIEVARDMSLIDMAAVMYALDHLRAYSIIAAGKF